MWISTNVGLMFGLSKSVNSEIRLCGNPAEEENDKQANKSESQDPSPKSMPSHIFRVKSPLPSDLRIPNAMDIGMVLDIWS